MANNINETDIFLEGDPNLLDNGTLGGGESGAVFGETIFRGQQYVIQDVGTTGSGYFSFGTSMLTVPTSPTTGTGVFINYSGVYGNAAGVAQFYLDAATGKAYAGAGAVTLDVNGVTLAEGNTDVNKVKWTSCGAAHGYLSTFTGTAHQILSVYATTTTVTSDYSMAQMVAVSGTAGALRSINLDLYAIGTTVAAPPYGSAGDSFAALYGGAAGVFKGLLIGQSIVSGKAPSSILHISDTAPTLRLEDTDGANDFLISHNTGVTNLQKVGGSALLALDLTNTRVGIGTSSPTSLLTLSETKSTNNAAYTTVSSTVTLQQTSNANFNNIIQNSTATLGIDSGITNTGANVGIQYAMQVGGNHAGTMSGTVRCYSAVITTMNGSAGTLGEARNIHVAMSGNATSTTAITNWRGVYVTTGSMNGATITNAYAHYVESITFGGTLNYAWYSNSGLVHFGDSVDLASGKNITLVAGNIVTDTSTGTKIGTGTTQKLGWWNATPVAQGTAFTQTYSTADKTLNADGVTDPAAYAAGANGYSTAAMASAVHAAVIALHADLLDVKQFVNSIVDQLQTYGIFA